MLEVQERYNLALQGVQEHQVRTLCSTNECYSVRCCIMHNCSSLCRFKGGDLEFDRGN